MYKFIKCPIKNKFLKINSNNGIITLKKYIKHYISNKNGGMNDKYFHNQITSLIREKFLLIETIKKIKRIDTQQLNSPVFINKFILFYEDLYIRINNYLNQMSYILFRGDKLKKKDKEFLKQYKIYKQQENRRKIIIKLISLLKDLKNIEEKRIEIETKRDKYLAEKHKDNICSTTDFIRLRLTDIKNNLILAKEDLESLDLPITSSIEIDLKLKNKKKKKFIINHIKKILELYCKSVDIRYNESEIFIKIYKNQLIDLILKYSRKPLSNSTKSRLIQLKSKL